MPWLLLLAALCPRGDFEQASNLSHYHAVILYRIDVLDSAIGVFARGGGLELVKKLLAGLRAFEQKLAVNFHFQVQGFITA